MTQITNQPISGLVGQSKDPHALREANKSVLDVQNSVLEAAARAAAASTPTTTSKSTVGSDIHKHFQSDIGFVNPPKQALSEVEKKKLESELSNLKGNETKVFHGISDSTVEITKAEIPSISAVVYLKKCSNAVFDLRTSCTKVMIEGCNNVTLNIHDGSRVLTQVLEAWNNTGDLTINSEASIKTYQIDLSEKVILNVSKREHFQQIVWATTQHLHLNVQDNDTEHKSGLHLVKQYNPIVDDRIDQFIVRFLKNKITLKEELREEMLVRLDNGFPTTEREAKDFDRRQEDNLHKLAQQLLGENIKLNKPKREGPKVKRNDPCTCGSARKFKQCCGSNKF